MFSGRQTEFRQVRPRGASPARPAPFARAGLGTAAHGDACACGGGCPRCLNKYPLQAKLEVSLPGDSLEQEADRVAEQVLRMPQPELPDNAEAHESTGLRLSRYSSGTSAHSSLGVPPIVHDVVRSPGEPLDPATRAFMEPRFGQDFSRVRVHSGAAAEQSAQDVNAKAYTVGHSIVFGDGRYAPATTEGRRLIAHELAHVVQNRDAPAAPTLRRSVESDARRIEELLSYGLFDWAITDADAIEALEILSNLPSDLQRNVLRRINLERLRDNLPPTHLPILERILADVGVPPASVREKVTHIQDLLSYGLFDWAITDSDVREAFGLLMSLPAAERQRVVRVINYQRLLDNLPDAADRMALEALRATAVAHETAELATMEGLRVRARHIVNMIKANADAMTLPTPPAGGAFETFLATEYLTAYCAAPSAATGGPAIDQMVLEGAGGFTHYGFGLLRDMAERARGRGIGFIDTPSLLGTPAPGAFTTTGAFDPWSQGPNPTQIMHFAAGIKWNWAPAALVQWYFLHYEEVSAEGWQIFGLDSLNDIIAEEGGRIVAEDLKDGRSCSGGSLDLDPYFARGRAFLRGELRESRLEALALRVHLPNLVVATGAAGGGVLSRPLYSMTIMEQLMVGASDAAVLASPDARILTLLFHLLRRG